MTVVYLGLGGNRGQRKFFLDEAKRRLDRLPDFTISICSCYYRTPGWGNSALDWFLNAALEAECGRSPDDLLAELKYLEATLGRRHCGRWQKRYLDLDILFWGSQIINKPHLQIPHPQVVNRMFVLEPLAEIAPSYIHPQNQRSISDLRDILHHNTSN